MKKVTTAAIIAALIILLFCTVRNSHQIRYSFADTIELPAGQKSADGLTVCSQDSKSYALYSLDRYNVDFDRQSILLTPYELNQVIVGKKIFINIFVGNKQKDVINVYLLNKPNLYFDPKDTLQSAIFYETILSANDQTVEKIEITFPESRTVIISDHNDIEEIMKTVRRTKKIKMVEYPNYSTRIQFDDACEVKVVYTNNATDILCISENKEKVYRYLETTGSCGDKGYIIGENMSLYSSVKEKYQENALR